MQSASTPDFSKRIQQLMDERQTHLDAAARIDETLKQVGAALGHIAKRIGRPPKALQVVAAIPAKRGRKPGRGRRRFGISGEEAVLTFIRQNKTPTTQEINKYWKGAGRGGTADNTLTKLVKAKQLKREPLDGQARQQILRRLKREIEIETVFTPVVKGVRQWPISPQQ